MLSVFSIREAFGSLKFFVNILRCCPMIVLKFRKTCFDVFLDDEGFEPGEMTEKKGDAWEGEDEDDDALKVRFISCLHFRHNGINDKI